MRGLNEIKAFRAFVEHASFNFMSFFSRERRQQFTELYCAIQNIFNLPTEWIF